jgi:hypothetical protein
MLANVFVAFDELISKSLLHVRCSGAQSGHTFDHLDRKMKPVEFIQNDYIEGRRRYRY